MDPFSPLGSERAWVLPVLVTGTALVGGGASGECGDAPSRAHIGRPVGRSPHAAHHRDDGREPRHRSRRRGAHPASFARRAPPRRQPRSLRHGLAAELSAGGRAGGHTVSHVSADLESLGSVRSAAAEICERLERGDLPPLRGFVGNAGIQYTNALTEGPDGFESTFAINVLADHLFVRLLQDRFVAPARIVITAGDTHFGDFKHNVGMVPGPAWRSPGVLARPGAFPDPDTAAGGRTAYSTSKPAAIYPVHEYARRLPAGSGSATVVSRSLFGPKGCLTSPARPPSAVGAPGFVPGVDRVGHTPVYRVCSTRPSARHVGRADRRVPPQRGPAPGRILPHEGLRPGSPRAAGACPLLAHLPRSRHCRPKESHVPARPC